MLLIVTSTGPTAITTRTCLGVSKATLSARCSRQVTDIAPHCRRLNATGRYNRERTVRKVVGRALVIQERLPFSPLHQFRSRPAAAARCWILLARLWVERLRPPVHFSTRPMTT